MSLRHLTHLNKLNLGSNDLDGPLTGLSEMTSDSSPGHRRNRFLRELCQDCIYSAASGGNKKNDLSIILGVLGGFTGLVLLCISAFLMWKCYMKTQFNSKYSGPAPRTPLISSNTSSKKSVISHKARQSTRSFTIEELRTATDDFRPENVVGEGGFGLVYKGTLSSGQEVAIKHAHNDALQAIEDFYNEVELLSKVHHKYLVDLVGFCDEQGEKLLVYEFVPNGNLFEYLCGQRTPPLTWRQRVHIAICCAKGLAHLHEGCSPSIIHRDIKPTNILIDNDYLAKVADFGLSKTGPVGGASHVSTGVKGTPGYLDPYYYLNWHLGAYSDVYSFGVILLQLVASKPAVDRKRRARNSNYSLISWAKDCLRRGHFDSIVDPKLRSQGYNRDILMVMVKLGIRCTEEEIKQRPSMKTIYQELEHALETLGSLTPVNGSLDDSSESSSGQPSEELTPGEGVITLSDLQSEQFTPYFDGRSWVDINDIVAHQFDEHAQDNEHRLQVSDIQLSNNSVYISIDSPEMQVVK